MSALPLTREALQRDALIILTRALISGLHHLTAERELDEDAAKLARANVAEAQALLAGGDEAAIARALDLLREGLSPLAKIGFSPQSIYTAATVARIGTTFDGDALLVISAFCGFGLNVARDGFFYFDDKAWGRGKKREMLNRAFEIFDAAAPHFSREIRENSPSLSERLCELDAALRLLGDCGESLNGLGVRRDYGPRRPAGRATVQNNRSVRRTSV